MLVAMMVDVGMRGLPVAQLITRVPQEPTLAQLRVRRIAHWGFGHHAAAIPHRS